MKYLNIRFPFSSSKELDEIVEALNKVKQTKAVIRRGFSQRIVYPTPVAKKKNVIR